jgi:RNA polymerase sigma-70 factor, ECF subfamily
MSGRDRARPKPWRAVYAFLVTFEGAAAGLLVGRFYVDAIIRPWLDQLGKDGSIAAINECTYGDFRFFRILTGIDGSTLGQFLYIRPACETRARSHMTVQAVKPSEDSSSTSSTLLARIRANDKEAWGRLVHLYGPLVFRWCRQAGLQETDAADIGQEVFRAVARRIGDFHHDRERGSFRGWLRTITRNKLRDLARRQPPGGRGIGGSDGQGQIQRLVAPVSADSGEEVDQAEDLIVLRRAVELVLDDCEAATRQAFWRVVVDGQTPADVASDLGLSINSVYLIKSRLLRRIRDAFAELEDL